MLILKSFCLCISQLPLRHNLTFLILANLMKTIITLSLLLCMQYAIFAQGSIKGRLVDAENKEGLISANVLLKGATTGTITDFDGYFSLDNVPEGEQLILISYLGYENKEQKVVVKNGETVDVGDIMVASSSVGLEEVKVVASIAIDRKTPVAVSSINADVIEDKLGNQEFPELLRATPSVYATKSGGGFGDARINVRGFDQRNTAVMINGIPVNDMENGWVYWSNWAGLSDVTRTMQVQRGLGASRLAISSVGGTINIITRTIDQKKGGSFSLAYGNNNYLKAALTLSTGRLKGDWALTFSGAYTRGDGYVDATQFQGGSYFLSISKAFGDKHQLVLTGIGALQRHGQRSYREKLMVYDSIYHHEYNSDWGYRDGKTFNIRENFYHKPQISLNHYWSINDKLTLSSSAYVSFGRGGGTGDRGSIGGKGTWGYRDDNGQMRIDDMVSWNRGTNDITGFPAAGKHRDPNHGYVAGERDGLIKRASMNSHDWYGLLSNLTADLSKHFMVSGGIDVRYYKGKHYRKIEDLMGADAWLDPRDINAQNDSLDLDGNGTISSKEKGALKKEGDKIHYDNDGIVSWQGVFAQVEYTSPFGLNAFISGAFSNSGYQRVDRFQYTGSDQTSPMYNFLGYTVKGGANYNLNKNHNVFFNTGFFSRAPIFDVVFPTYNNVANENAKNEEVFGVELGYGIRYAKFAANLNLYHTRWMNKSFFKKSITPQGNDVTANITGLNAVHQGIEIDLNATPIKGLNLRAMFSLGDWQWKNNVDAAIADDNNIVFDTVKVYADGLKVGDAPQTTFGVGAAYTFPFGLSIDADYWHCWELYADFDPANKTSTNDIGRQALKLPSYGLLDAGISYKIQIKKVGLKLRFSMNNILGTRYVAEADDNFSANTNYNTLLSNARGFYGFGRTWNVSLKFTF